MVAKVAAPWLLAVLALVLLAAPARAQEAIRIVEGRIVNATLGDAPVEGVTVELHMESAAEHRHLSTVTDDRGAFHFSEVPYDPDTAYGVSVNYQGGLYGADLDLSGEAIATVTVQVYESTNDTSVLKATTVSLVFVAVEQAQESVWALEMVRLINDSNRTYVPGPGPMDLVRFGLPPGASDLQVDSDIIGAEFFQVDRGFALLGAVPPGEHQVLYSYRFPYGGSSYAFQRTLRYGAETLRVLAPKRFMTLAAPGLGPVDEVQIGEASYYLLEASGLEPGRPITLELTGLPRASLLQRLGRLVSGVKVGLAAASALGFLMALLVVLALWRRAARREIAGSGESEVDRERRLLARLLEELEAQYQDGRMNEGEYLRRRSALLARLGALSEPERIP